MLAATRRLPKMFRVGVYVCGCVRVCVFSFRADLKTEMTSSECKDAVLK